MRTEKEMMELIVNYAKNDDCVRLITMEGSKLNKNVPVDNFQDFDVSYTVTNMDKYLANDSWLDFFGKRIIMQKPEAMPLFPPNWLGKCNKFSYLIIFEDGRKMDLTLVPLKHLEYFLEERDSLFKVILDKDNICPVINEPSDIDFHVKRPSSDFIDNCCNEFWLLSTYVTKGLCRNEPIFAIKHLDLMKEQLLNMVSWKVGIETSFSLSVGKSYKYLDKYVSKSTREKISQTYKNDSTDGIWDSLIICCNLFQEITNYVIAKLDYKHPEYNKKVINHIRQYFPENKKNRIEIL